MKKHLNVRNNKINKKLMESWGYKEKQQEEAGEVQNAPLSDQDVTKQVKDVVANNQFWKSSADKVEAEAIHPFEAKGGKYLYFNPKGWLDSPHLKHHFSEEGAMGSTWGMDSEKVNDFLIDTALKTEPNFVGEDRGSFKIKWLNKEHNGPVGKDRIKKRDKVPNKEVKYTYTRPEEYPYEGKSWPQIEAEMAQNKFVLVKASRDDPPEYYRFNQKDFNNKKTAYKTQEVAVVYTDNAADMETNLYNFILVSLGQTPDGRHVMAPMTAFPGEDVGVRNKSELIDNGYVILQPTSAEQANQKMQVYSEGKNIILSKNKNNRRK